MGYCQSPFLFQRRKTREVIVGDPAHGGVIIGGDHPVVNQSMLTCDTMNTELCIKQTLELVAVGCQIVRITAPTVKDAANLKNIAAGLHSVGCYVPLVADIHFKPEAAMEAIKWVEMVRVNPGNYADKKKFAAQEYNDAQYAEELKRIEQAFTPLVLECKRLKRALRIGTNHGSLSDRILNRYGDTPLGMVESALEFAQIARKLDFHNFKFSMKSSNPKVMIECYRLLVDRLEKLGPDWNYPIHLGVTEAGGGEDGRIKGAIGIGSLLCDGLGDTMRVSLTEDSPHELQVCRDLNAQIPALTLAAEKASPQLKKVLEKETLSFDPLTFTRRESTLVEWVPGIFCGGTHPVRVVMTRAGVDALPSNAKLRPEGVLDDLKIEEIDPTSEFTVPSDSILVSVKDGTPLPTVSAFRLLAAKLKRLGHKNPILLKDCLDMPKVPLASNVALLRASIVMGSLLADGIGDAVLIRGEGNPEKNMQLAFNILQAAGCRSFKTDYVACPSCGRTLFNLQTVTAAIKARTRHLKGVKIAIMGCIVNGPGEMADAHFGYVGGAPGKVNLYVGKTPVKFNVPESEAVDRLVDLIRENGKWVEP